MPTGFYLLPAIPPHCAATRRPATLLQTLPNGRVLLRDDSITTPGKEFLIETTAESFEATPAPLTEAQHNTFPKGRW